MGARRTMPSRRSKPRSPEAGSLKPTKKMRRTDHAERLIAAPLVDVFAAFTSATKLAKWLPPEGATGTFEHVDLRAGGGFLMRLTFDDADVETKSDDDSDVVEVYKSEEHTSELQSLMRISYAVFSLKKKK